MTQFNMQIDPTLNQRLRELQKRLGLASKAEVVRWTVEYVHARHNLRRRTEQWWKDYRDRCARVPRRRGGRLMTEDEFYRDLF